MTNGCFISLEGGEGTGKSTQISRLAERLRTAGHVVKETRDPGGSEGAEAIRELLLTGSPDRWDAMTEALLHFAARRDYVQRIIRPALETGAWVITDRFADSTVAYQGVAGGAGRETVEGLWDLVLEGLKPDLTLILDLPIEVGLDRAGVRFDQQDQTASREDRYELKGAEFHESLRQAFLESARLEPDRCVAIDATGTEDEVHEAIWAVVSARLEV